MARIEIVITEEGYVDELSFCRGLDDDNNPTDFWILEQEEIADHPASIGNSYKLSIHKDVVAAMIRSMSGYDLSIEESCEFSEDPGEFAIIRVGREIL